MPPRRRTPAACPLSAVTLNVQHLSVPKLLALVSWAMSVPAVLFFFQECAMQDDPLGAPGQLEAAGCRWPGLHFWSPGTPHSKGCLVLVKEHVHLTDVSAPVVDPNGRFLRLDCVFHDTPMSFVNVYAPAHAADRPGFFLRELPAALPPPDPNRVVCLGGDLNCVHSDLDCVRAVLPPGASSRTVGSHELHALMLQHDLLDVWRHDNPAGRTFTHWHPASHSGARLDRWLVSAGHVQRLRAHVHHDAAPPIHTDHLPVTLTLTFGDPVPRGPGLWRLPLPMLDWPNVRAELDALFAADRAAHEARVTDVAPLPPDYHRTRWLVLKEAVHHRLRTAYIQGQRAACRDRARLHAAAAVALGHLVAQPAAPHAHAQWRAAVQAIIQAQALRAQHTAHAVSVLAHLYGDRPTLFFHSRLKPHCVPTCIRTLKDPAGGEPADLTTQAGVDAAKAIFVRHYSGDVPGGVYSARVVQPAARATLLAALPRTLPAPMAAACEGPHRDGRFTVGELERALRACARGRAPGRDGLPMEFYMYRWEDVGGLLVAAFNEALHDPTPAALAEFLLGVIVLVHKPGRPADSVTGYRPITLLDCDLKILAKAVGDRLQVPLDFLIDDKQSAFILGRDIHDNVLYHLSLAEYLRSINHPCWIVLTDLAAAYDSVDWGYLHATMAAMGFHAHGHVRWAALLHQGARCQVMVNGQLSDPFPLRSGLLQGSGASPLFWCIVLQPLSAYLTSLAAAGRIRPPPIPSRDALRRFVQAQAHPDQAFADDVNLADEDLDTHAPVLVGAFHLLHDSGGPALSIPKCNALPISGPQAALQQAAEPVLHAASGFCIPPIASPPKLLGIPFAPTHPAIMCELAFADRMPKLEGRAASWRPLGLNLIGRAHVAKACLQGSIVYRSSIVPAPPAHLRALQRTIRHFISHSSLPDEQVPSSLAMYPREAVCALPHKDGGIAMAHLPTHQHALQAKVVAQLFSPRARHWQPIMMAQFAAVDVVASLPSWVVTNPAAYNLSAINPRLHAYVLGFRHTRPHRVVLPPDQTFHSILAEPLYHNLQVKSDQGDTLLPAMLSTPAAKAWRYVRDLRSVPGPMTPAVAADHALLLSMLPAPWADAVQRPVPPQPSWVCTLLHGVVYVWAPPTLEGGGLHAALPNGRLVAAADVHADEHALLLGLRAAPAASVVAAAVFALPKPQYRWTDEEWEDHRRARANHDPDYLPPTELWFLGQWDHVVLDPSVWGHGGVSLLHYTVKHAHARCVQLMFMEHDASYVPSCGVRPKLWAPPAADPAAPAPCGVTAVQARWLASYTQRLQRQQALEDEGRQGLDAAVRGGVGAAAAGPFPWWDLQRARVPRVHAIVRTAQRRALQPVPAVAAPRRRRVLPAATDDTVDALTTRDQVEPRVSYRAVWTALLDPGIMRVHRVVAWRILHGALLVNAFHAHVHGDHLPLHAAYCSHPDCHAAAAVETLTHAFMDCPQVAPAIDWLLDLWAAISGSRPPRAARVLLADDYLFWAPAGPLVSLWSRLRITMLGCIWHCRCRRHDSGAVLGGMSGAVVAMFIDHVTHAINRDWLRVTRDVRLLSDQYPSNWFAGQDPATDVDWFRKQWCWRDVLCRVRGEDAADMDIRLSRSQPVPAPGFGADPAEIHLDL